MKWYQPKPGDTRVISKFLLFPRTINSITRWLEFAEIKQTFYSLEGWEDDEWTDNLAPG